MERLIYMFGETEPLNPAAQEKGTLSWALVPEADVVWFAYFAPYSLEQHNDLIAMAASSALGASSSRTPPP